jgi:hypothetical protein
MQKTAAKPINSIKNHPNKLAHYASKLQNLQAQTLVHDGDLKQANYRLIRLIAR